MSSFERNRVIGRGVVGNNDCYHHNSRPTMNPIELSCTLETPTNLIKGLDGKSAYEYAVEGGYKGTEEEFYENLANIGNLTELTTENITIGKDIKVVGTSLGGYKEGDKVSTSDILLSVLQKFLTKRLPATYTQPEARLSLTNFTTQLEVGESVTVTIESLFIKNDAGDLISNQIFIDDVLANQDNNSTIEKTLEVKDGENKISNSISYSEGPIKKDNLGDDSPEGRILSGIVKSERILNGVRALFMTSQTDYMDLQSSNDVRSLPAKILNPLEGLSYELNIADGHKFIAICYPKYLGKVKSIIQSSVNLDIQSSFSIKEFQVSGANNKTPIDYYIYTYRALVGLSKDKYIINL